MFHPTHYTVESVTSGHPDKVCDQISDAILDACLAQDSHSRVAAEALGSHGLLVIGGEVSTKAAVDYAEVARALYKNIGYTDDLKIISHITTQSPDIAQGVDTGGAGDQGIMYGFATNETREKLPRAVVLVHQLTKGLEDLRTSGLLPWLGPDGKAQITMEDDRIITALVSTQHNESVSQEEIKSQLVKHLFEPVLGDIEDIEILVNPTGSFVKGGFEADAGLTGRKLMVDTYGGLVPHGGGAFSGKDATKVDRSAAYMARYVAKNLVANELAEKAHVSVAYAIGRAEPVMIKAFNQSGKDLSEIVKEKFDFKPQAIIEQLGLRQPIFQLTAAYGHFGREEFPWERIVTI